MGDDRPISYREEGISYYRASGSGSCLRAIVAAGLGYKGERTAFTENVMMSAAKEGNLHEGAIIDELINTYGWRIRGSQDLVEMKIIPKVFIRGHTDGICIPKGMRNDRLLEVKTMSKDRFKKWMACGNDVMSRLLTDDFLKYAWQISNYMHAYNLPAMYVVKNRDSGILDIGELKLPPISKKEIRKKIIEAEMWIKRGELPPCNAASGEKFFCEYPYLHESDIAFSAEPSHEPDVFDDATSVLVAGIAEHYADLVKQVAMLKPLDEERKSVGKRLIEAMGGALGPKKVVAGGWSVKRTDSSSTYVDKVGVASDLGISIEEYEVIVNQNKKNRPYSYVTVKNLGDK